jgi:hypothetical protein
MVRSLPMTNLPLPRAGVSTGGLSCMPVSDTLISWAVCALAQPKPASIAARKQAAPTVRCHDKEEAERMSFALRHRHVAIPRQVVTNFYQHSQ